MERLTMRNVEYNGTSYICQTGEAAYRLAAIEDILGDDYNLDRLRDLMEAASHLDKPLTQSDLDEMHFERVWIDYGPDETGERCGEEGVVLYGRFYSIDALGGAGFEALLLDAMSGETLDNPTGTYAVYRRPPKGREAEECHD